MILIKSTSTKLDLFTLRVFPILMKMCWKWKINFGECPHWQNVRILLFLVYRNESQKILNVKYLTVSSVLWSPAQLKSAKSLWARIIFGFI